ncbi:MAG: hypothetical protein V8Q17_08765 [Acutalibacteraceae bacterium]
MMAVIYARYSDKVERGKSRGGQLKECYECAEANGYTVIYELLTEH